MVVDTSAFLAVVLGERHGKWVADHLSECKAPLLMCQVNVCGTYSRFDRRGSLRRDAEHYRGNAAGDVPL